MSNITCDTTISLANSYNYNHLNHSYLQYEPRYNLSATSCPYWDDSCGITFTEINDFIINLELINNTYNTFNPRDYIIKTLSPKVCYERIISEFNV